MFDRFAMRSSFWTGLGALAVVSTAASAVRLVRVSSAENMSATPAANGTAALWNALPGFLEAAPFLSAAALLLAMIGWRLLHRELLLRTQDDATLRERVRRLNDAMHVNADGMFLLRTIRAANGEISDFEISDVNASGATLLYAERLQLLGQRLLRDLPAPISRPLFERYVEMITLQTSLSEEIRSDRRQVAAGWLFHQAAVTVDGLAVTVRDISARKREEARLRKESLTDHLTRLYNRRGFLTLADQHLRIARRQGKDAVLMYVDMDDFKQLNDQHGHATGDRALTAIARLLQSTMRDCDVVARMGGDEFTILALDADGIGARIIQRRIEERVALLNATGELPVPVSLTIGHTRVRPSDQASLPELLSRADQLLYARKRRRQLTRIHVAQQPAGRVSHSVPRVGPTPVPAEVAAIARAAALALPAPGSGAVPVALPNLFIPTHAA